MDFADPLIIAYFFLGLLGLLCLLIGLRLYFFSDGIPLNRAVRTESEQDRHDHAQPPPRASSTQHEAHHRENDFEEGPPPWKQ